LLITLFFIIGVDENNEALRIYYYSYFANIFIPFGFYFCFVVYLRVSSILVYFALARVFDPVDFVMYGSGVLLVLIFDRFVFCKVFWFWS